MPTALETLVRKALDAVADPVSGKGLSSSGRVTGLVVRSDGKVGFVLETGVGAADEPLRKAAEEAVMGVNGVTAVTAVLTAEATTGARAVTPPSRSTAIAPPPSPAARQEVTRPARGIVAIASAKGGVGKSTVAVNLAVAAAKNGLRVGLLDADVFGPSLPTMLGTVGKRPELTAAKKMKPVMAHGLATMSIGYLVDPDQAVVWRGPMVMSAVSQLINDTDWGDLDLLFIDTPPGTGEVQLTLVQKLPLDGAVIVSTPQEVALADVRRGVGMFRKTAVPVLGVIENMAWFEQPDGSRAYIFGKEGAQRTAEDMNVPFLGALPILPVLREGGDAGVPAATGDSNAAEAFRLLAEAVNEALAASPNKPAPTIVFE
ncbi:MAG: Mrp/NBP35 family ATP-binding protein [Hyphomonadaceae bacterium]|nr:Mrp/NBP35 family ATP-binding protein [Hyphomonadaceae bacterium]